MGQGKKESVFGLNKKKDTIEKKNPSKVLSKLMCIYGILCPNTWIL